MNLPIEHVEHIHKKKDPNHTHLLLLMLPAIVFFLVIALSFFKISSDNKITTISPQDTQVLGRDSGVDN